MTESPASHNAPSHHFQKILQALSSQSRTKKMLASAGRQCSA